MKMSNVKKIGVTKYMDYPTCLNKCIAAALQEGPAGAAEIYMNLPKPSPAEWAACIHEVVEYPTEDARDPHHLMGRWELRLHKSGIPTALGMVAARFENSIDYGSMVGTRN